jgi:probable HAF family extracellular repeat protein
MANAINASGQVAGYGYAADNAASQAILWNSTTATELGAGTVGGTNSVAYAINASGQVAGFGSTNGNAAYHATLWNGTTSTDLGTLGGDYSFASAINASGQVAGWSNLTGNVQQHATLWNGRTITDLNSFLDASTVSAGWVLNYATGINDNGWIVGSASNSLLGITNHAFVMSVAPVPEPDSYAMALIGLGLMGFVARRRKSEQA